MSWENLRKIIFGLNCIEIGAPTPAFMSHHKDFPECNLYDVINSLDAINIFEENPFQNEKHLSEKFEFEPGKYINKRYNIDASSNEILKISDKYDCLLTSHVIEHIANPIKAVKNWKELIRSGGYIVIVAPEKMVCHDRYRQYTTFEHILDDYKNNVDGSDMTHIQEILECNAQNFPLLQFKTLSSNNKVTNVIHHHCFSLDLLEQMGEYCGLKKIICFNYDVFKLQNVYVGEV